MSNDTERQAVLTMTYLQAWMAADESTPPGAAEWLMESMHEIAAQMAADDAAAEPAPKPDGMRPAGNTVGSCRRSAQGTDSLGAVCPQCGHSVMLHPGRLNPGLSECFICSVSAALAQLRVVLGGHR